MTTFYDPAKIRELAAAGDPFWKGAAWILDQQDAAAVATAPTEDEYRRAYVTPNAADLGAPRIG